MTAEEQISQQAISATLGADMAYCKFLSANDSGETGAHQSGILIANSAKGMMFSDEELSAGGIPKKLIKIRWQDDFSTDGCFTWYASKHEFRLTRMGRGFPFLRPEYTGALFILTKCGDEQYDGFFLNTENAINQYLDTFGLTPAETNRLIELEAGTRLELAERQAIDSFIDGLEEDFPASDTMSSAARDIFRQARLPEGADALQLIRNDPDNMLRDWTDEEYRLFKALEHARYGALIEKGFQTVDDFIALANQVLNRRKSRAGKSLEHHLSAIFDACQIRYTAQGITEGNKRPDFIFPSIEDYHNVLFSVDGLCTLAAKTTCKDRWRQVLNEADRLRDRNKYLCTLQQGISSAQLDEMSAEKVVLVVPKHYISTYPTKYQDSIWTVRRFVGYVREMEGM